VLVVNARAVSDFELAGLEDFLIGVLVDAGLFHLGLGVFITSQGCATNGS
jgi:hypothetical protein